MIQLTDVSKWYQMGEVRVTALDEISLRVERGEFVVDKFRMKAVRCVKAEFLSRCRYDPQ